MYLCADVAPALYSVRLVVPRVIKKKLHVQSVHYICISVHFVCGHYAHACTSTLTRVARFPERALMNSGIERVIIYRCVVVCGCVWLTCLVVWRLCGLCIKLCGCVVERVIIYRYWLCVVVCG